MLATKPEVVTTAQPPMPDLAPVALDLFCGAGGLSLGFERAGYRIGLGVEKDELACQTHRHNFGDHCYLGDIQGITDPEAFVREQNLERVDVIIGGLSSVKGKCAPMAIRIAD